MEKIKSRFFILLRALTCAILIMIEIVYLYSDYKPSNVVDSNYEMSSIRVSMFNSMISKFFGEELHGNNLKYMIETINTINHNQEFPSKISVKYYGLDEIDDNIFNYDKTITLNIKDLSKSNFKVGLSGYNSNGYMNEVTIIRLPNNRNMEIVPKLNEDGYSVNSQQIYKKNIDANPMKEYIICFILIVFVYLIYNIVIFFIKEFKKSLLMVDIFINFVITIPSILLFIISIIGLLHGGYAVIFILVSLVSLLIPIFLIKVKRRYKDLSYGSAVDLDKLGDYFFATIVSIVINMIIINVALQLYN